MDITRYLLIAWRLCISTDYRFVRQRRLFDSGYFTERAGEKYRRCVDPLWDYLKITGRDFDAMLDCGCWQQLADPHPLFDTSYYLLRYFPEGLPINPFIHYLREGWRHGYWPGPFLDPQTYRRRSSWDESQGDPLSHYSHHGAITGVSPSPFFDVDWYLDRNPGLKQVRTEIIKHYKLYGARIGKSPVPVFEPAYYCSLLATESADCSDPLSSYLATARQRAGDRPRPARLFDPVYYRSQNEVSDVRGYALSHYLGKGLFEKRYSDERIARLVKKPVISILVPVYNPAINCLNNCIRSVLYQAYPHWELCLVDDSSSDPEIRRHLETWAAVDPRIKIGFHDKNTGISATTNSAAALAAGDYLAFLDNDDELSADCLYHVAEAINKTEAHLFYSDEDLIGDDGSRLSVFRKPDFNRELLFTHNYITHFVVVSAALFHKIGGFDSRYDGAQDFDLLLRVSEETEKIHHIPLILYHWRASESSTSINHEQKSYAHEAGKTALEQSLKRRKCAASVEETGIRFYYRPRFQAGSEPDVSVFLWPAAESCSPGESLATLRRKTGYGNSEFIVVGAGGQPSRDNLPADIRVKNENRPQAHHAKEMSKTWLLHSRVLACSGEYLVFVNSPVLDCSDGWLEELVSCYRQRPDIGIVCGRILYAGDDGPSYTIPDIGNESPDYFARFLASCSKHMNGVHCSQLVRLCDGDFCLLSRSTYEELGGLDHLQFPHLLAMHDFSFRVAETGKKIVYTPYASITAPVSGNAETVGDSVRKFHHGHAEKRRFQTKWEKMLTVPDPFYSFGILRDHTIDRDRFEAWLSGKPAVKKALTIR